MDALRYVGHRGGLNRFMASFKHCKPARNAGLTGNPPRPRPVRFRACQVAGVLRCPGCRLACEVPGATLDMKHGDEFEVVA